MSQRLSRSRTDRMLAGVCGGLAEYFDIDPTIVRVVFAVATVMTALLPGILLYAVMALVMPADSSLATDEAAPRPARRAALAGVILVVMGALLLLGNFGVLAWWSWGRLWPLVLILAGAILLMRRRE